MPRPTQPTFRNGEMHYPNPEGEGVVYSRSGWLWLSHGELRRTCRPKVAWPRDDHSRKDRLGLTKPQRDAIERALVQLRAMIAQGASGGSSMITTTGTVPAISDAPGKPWIYELCAEYAELRKAAKHGYAKARSLLDRYVMAGGDFQVSFENLEGRLRKTLATMALRNRTVETIIGELNIFIRWLVDRRLISASPLPGIGVVWTITGEAKENRVWSIKEIGEHLDYFRTLKHPASHHMSLLLRLMLRTGIRTGEALKMRPEHVSDGSFLILGKPSPVRRAKLGTTLNVAPDRLREFPLYLSDGQEAIPGVVAIIEELMDLHRAGQNGFDLSRARPGRRRKGDWVDNSSDGWEYLFPWPQGKDGYMSLHRLFQPCRIACGHDVDLPSTECRSLKHYRKTAVWWWEHSLGLPIDVRSSLAGHTEQVQARNYMLRTATVEDLVRKIELKRQYATPQVDLPY